MKMLLDIYLQQSQPNGEQKPLLAEPPTNFSTIPIPLIKMSLPCTGDIALASEVVLQTSSCLCARVGFQKEVFMWGWVKRGGQNGERVGQLWCGVAEEEGRTGKPMPRGSVITGVICIGVEGILVLKCHLLSTQKPSCVLQTPRFQASVYVGPPS